MKHRALFLVAASLALQASVAVADTLPTPTFPQLPQSRAQCDAVSKQYSENQKEIGRRHEACLNSQSCKKAKRAAGGACSCAACENLHVARDRYGNGDIAKYRRAGEQRCLQVVRANEDAARRLRQQQQLAARQQQQAADRQQAARQQQLREAAERQRQLALNEQRQRQLREQAVPRQPFAPDAQQPLRQEVVPRLPIATDGQQQLREEIERRTQLALDEQRRQQLREEANRRLRITLDEQRQRLQRDEVQRQEERALAEQLQQQREKAELDLQLALIKQGYRETAPRQSPAPSPPVTAPPAPTPPASLPASGVQRLRDSVARAGDRWDALMQSNVKVGDTALNVGGLKDTLVKMTAKFLSEISPSTLLRALGKSAGKVATNPVLDQLGPLLEPENGRNVYATVEALVRQEREGSINESSARQLSKAMADQ